MFSKGEFTFIHILFPWCGTHSYSSVGLLRFQFAYFPSVDGAAFGTLFARLLFIPKAWSMYVCVPKQPYKLDVYDGKWEKTPRISPRKIRA